MTRRYSLSVDFMWVMSRAPDAVMSVVKELYEEAVRSTLVPPEVAQALDAWRRVPGSLSAYTANDFDRAFCLEGMRPFVDDLIRRKELSRIGRRTGFEPDAENSALLRVSRVPPTSVLWYALGPERAARLPGFYGNAVLSSTEVISALETVREVFDMSEEGRAAALQRAREWLAFTECNEGMEFQILRMLPEELARADAEGMGFLVVDAMLR